MTELSPGDVITYTELCVQERAHLQRGMNFRLHGGPSVVLMSRRPNAPYTDEIKDNGKTLIYEGHNAPRDMSATPDSVDQPDRLPSGRLTQNGLFHQAAQEYRTCAKQPEYVKVYEKMRDGIWVYNGMFRLVDSWREQSDSRMVWKFRLEIVDDDSPQSPIALDRTRMIPSHVKQDVWKRDGGKCVLCGSNDNLHFDHVIPYAKGGTSLAASNIQLLCAHHNLRKSDKIE